MAKISVEIFAEQHILLSDAPPQAHHQHLESPLPTGSYSWKVSQEEIK